MPVTVVTLDEQPGFEQRIVLVVKEDLLYIHSGDLTEFSE
jgi:hypothetical protein